MLDIYVYIKNCERCEVSRECNLTKLRLRVYTWGLVAF